MKNYISLLRGINVSGQKKIKMEELRALYEGLGFENVQSYIQSGNVLFSGTETKISVLTKKIVEAIQHKYGFEVELFITSKKELKAIISKNPFIKNEDIDIKALYVSFLSDKPDAALVKTLDPFKAPEEAFIIDKQSIYLYLANGAGRTKLTNNLFERKLKLSATTRNWRTVNKLLDMVTSG